MARPSGVDELKWLRGRGIQLVITLTESPLRRDWVGEAGLLPLHIPIVDFTAPTPEQFEQALSAIAKARGQGFGTAVHCAAGLGRTGTVIAAYMISQGLAASVAIAKVRELRPGSIETREQELALQEFASRPKGD